MNKKSVIVPIRYDIEQKNYHQKKADEANLSFSEFLRQSADNSEIIVKDFNLILKAIEAINRIGNNTNQMAKTANSANLSGNVSDDMLNEFCLRLQLHTAELKSLLSIIKMKVN